MKSTLEQIRESEEYLEAIERLKMYLEVKKVFELNNLKDPPKFSYSEVIVGIRSFTQTMSQIKKWHDLFFKSEEERNLEIKNIQETNIEEYDEESWD